MAAAVTNVTFVTGSLHGNGLVVLVAAPDSVPDPPTGVSAVGGNAQATVSLTPPADNGGQPVSHIA